MSDIIKYVIIIIDGLYNMTTECVISIGYWVAYQIFIHICIFIINLIINNKNKKLKILLYIIFSIMIFIFIMLINMTTLEDDIITDNQLYNNNITYLDDIWDKIWDPNVITHSDYIWYVNNISNSSNNITYMSSNTNWELYFPDSASNPLNSSNNITYYLPSNTNNITYLPNNTNNITYLPSITNNITYLPSNTNWALYLPNSTSDPINFNDPVNNVYRSNIPWLQDQIITKQDLFTSFKNTIENNAMNNWSKLDRTKYTRIDVLNVINFEHLFTSIYTVKATNFQLDLKWWNLCYLYGISHHNDISFDMDSIPRYTPEYLYYKLKILDDNNLLSNFWSRELAKYSDRPDVFYSYIRIIHFVLNKRI